MFVPKSFRAARVKDWKLLEMTGEMARGGDQVPEQGDKRGILVLGDEPGVEQPLGGAQLVLQRAHLLGKRRVA